MRFFRKFPGTAENVLKYSILGVYVYCSNDKKIIEMEVDLELEMKLSRRELRLLLLHEFRLARKATSNICATMSKHLLSIRTAQHWFHRFQKLDDLPHSGRPLQVDIDLLKEPIEQDPRLTTSCLAERLRCSHIPIETHLHELGTMWKYGVWIPHELSPLQLQQRVDACMELMTSHRNYQWLNNFVIGDEKWLLYINCGYHRQWLSLGQTGVVTPKPDLHPKKVMLSVWWCVRGIIHW